MHLHTKFARLSRQAMTSEHGRLLQDSGFTKQDSPQSWSLNSGRTTIRDLTEWSYPSGVRTGRWSSGRPAMQSIPRTGGLSTSAQAFREIASMYSTQELLDVMRDAIRKLKEYQPMSPYFLPKTSYQRLSVLSREQGLAMPSWVQPLGSIQLRCFSDLEDRYYSGLTPTGQARMRELLSQDSFDLSALSRYP